MRFKALTSKSLETNVINEILTPGGLLWDYPTLLLQEKFRDQTRCNDIIRAIAEGNQRFSEISKKTEIQSVVLPRYLCALYEIGYIEHSFSVDQNIKKRRHTKNGLYFINDNFINFSYKIVWSNRGILDFGWAEEVWSNEIKNKLNEIATRPFVEICRQYLWKLNLSGNLPFIAKDIGGWWNKSERIDLMAIPIEGNARLFAECKFSDETYDLIEYEKLRKKIDNVPHDDEYIVLFSKSGFSDTIQILDQNSNEHLTLISLTDIVEGVMSNIR